MTNEKLKSNKNIRKIFFSYGNSYFLRLPSIQSCLSIDNSIAIEKRFYLFVIGPHWIGVVFTIGFHYTLCYSIFWNLGVIIGGTILNLRILKSHKEYFTHSFINFIHIFIPLFFVLTIMLLILTATTEPG